MLDEFQVCDLRNLVFRRFILRGEVFNLPVHLSTEELNSQYRLVVLNLLNEWACMSVSVTCERLILVTGYHVAQ